jgi:hypothetical protein
VKITGYRTAVPTPEFHRPRFRPVDEPEKGVISRITMAVIITTIATVDQFWEKQPDPSIFLCGSRWAAEHVKAGKGTSVV